MNNDLQALPKLRDSISYIYLEHAIIEQNDSSIVAIQKDGHIPIPISALTCLMLGPGTSVTHAAMKAAAEHGCIRYQNVRYSNPICYRHRWHSVDQSQAIKPFLSVLAPHAWG